MAMHPQTGYPAPVADFVSLALILAFVLALPAAELGAVPDPISKASAEPQPAAAQSAPVNHEQSPVPAAGQTGARTASRTISYSYDGAGRLTGVNLGDGKSLAYSYDSNGNLLGRTVAGTQTQSRVSLPLVVNSFNPGW